MSTALLVGLPQRCTPISFRVDNETVQEGLINFESYVSDVSTGSHRISCSYRPKKPTNSLAIVIKNGLVPSASGSAYLEYEASSGNIAEAKKLSKKEPSVKLSCTVSGPRPLPHFAPYTPQLLLSTCVRLAPFATRQRRNYIRGATERDLSIHLETALRGVIICERWPKSGVEIVITVLESEEDYSWSQEEIRADSNGLNAGWGMMALLSGCITVASAALVDAGIDCIDLVCGGMAAIVRQPTLNLSIHGVIKSSTNNAPNAEIAVVLDPCPAEYPEMVAGCVVGYSPSRDEVTELWVKCEGLGSTASRIRGMTWIDFLTDQAIEAAKMVRLVLVESINERTAIRSSVRSSDNLKD